MDKGKQVNDRHGLNLSEAIEYITAKGNRFKELDEKLQNKEPNYAIYNKHERTYNKLKYAK